MIGRPVADSLSPRMQNAAFAALRLDWTYLAFDVGDPSRGRSCARDARLRGCQRDDPPQASAVAALCDEAEGDAVNTLVFSDGRVLGFNTDREILAGISCDARLPDRGGRRCAGPLGPALPADTRVYSRSGCGPPTPSGCDLVVNATPVREELLVEPVSGQVVVDLAYGPRGDRARRSRAPCRLRGRRRAGGAGAARARPRSASGPASIRRVDVMRRALTP